MALMESSSDMHRDWHASTFHPNLGLAPPSLVQKTANSDAGTRRFLLESRESSD